MVSHPNEGAPKGGAGQAKKRPVRKADATPAPARSQKADRIAKVLARAGVASRREVERLIGLGRVAVNGRILDTPATLITREDVVTLDGKPIAAAEATRVWRYHKPVGLLTTHFDPEGRPTVFGALPADLPRVISVGRLDVNSEGLLLLTNDGGLSRALELPSTGLTRRYRARARGSVTQKRLDTLKSGIEVEGVRYGPIEATLDKAKAVPEGAKAGANLWITVSIAEGKNREVRKVLEALGLAVNRLIRLSYGPFALGTLPVGEVEEVGPRVIREMLGQYIAPEALPQGEATQGGPAPTGRRGLADPSKKPSRVRARQAVEDAAIAARAERAAERPARTFDHQRPAPGGLDRPKRTFGAKPAYGDRPRPSGPREDRPARAFGDKPAYGKPRAGGETAREARPANERYYGPGDGTAGPKTSGSGERPRGRPAFGAKPGYGGKAGPRGEGKPGGFGAKSAPRGPARPSGAKFGPRPGGPKPGGRPGAGGGPRKPRG